MLKLRQLTRSVFFKFSAAFIIVGLIPMFLLSFYSVRTFSTHVERYTKDNLQQMVMFMGYNLNAAFTQYDDISKLMYTGRYEGYVDSSGVNQTRNVNEFEQINAVPIDSFLKTILYSDPYITSVYFVRSSDRKFYYETRLNAVFNRDRLPLDQWFVPLTERPRNEAFIPTHKADYFGGPTRYVMTVGRNLFDISAPLTANPQPLGTLFFDVGTGLFDHYFSEMKLLRDNDELYVLDGAGHVFFSNRDVYGQRIDVSDRSDARVLAMSEPVSYLNGRIVARISKQQLFQQLSSTRSAVFTAIAICALVLIIMGAWFSRRLASPIRSVIQQMAKVESGNLQTRVEVNSNDEIGRLGRGFNRMVERLRAYINDAYVAEIKQKQTELNALKSQIRPHYLYNTLEVIRMNAVHSDAPEVGDMILALSNQLKYVIDYREEWVPLREELDHLNDYFYIIQVRFEGRFDLRIEIAEDVSLDWAAPKLSLQPFVENAIQHGLQPQGRGTVCVSVIREGDKLVIMIDDDGVGMEKPQLGRLAAMLENGGSSGRHVGMKNVQERIRSLCGEQFGVSVASRPHIGTSITIELPINEVKEVYDDDTGSSGRR